MRVNYIRKDLQYLLHDNLKYILHYTNKTIEDLANECGMSRVGLSQILKRCREEHNPGIGGCTFLGILHAAYILVEKSDIQTEIYSVCIKKLNDVRNDYLEKGFYEQKGDIPDER